MDKLKILSTQELLALLKQLIQPLNSKDQTTINAAVMLVEKIHENQDRPDGPYINHVLRVAIRYIQFGFTDVKGILAALFHDSVEDQAERIASMLVKLQSTKSIQEQAFSRIQVLYGIEVEQILRALTNPDWSHITDSTEVYALYVEHVRHLLKEAPLTAKRIKLADFSENGLDIESVTDEEKQLRWAKKYQPLYDLFLQAIEVEKLIDITHGENHKVIESLMRAKEYAHEKLMA